MSEAKCYLCAKPGKCEKLFRNCKHESACYVCLRARYVIRAQHDVSSSYPMKCFHPECNLVIRHTQMRRFVRSEKELRKFHILDKRAKIPAKMAKVMAKVKDEMRALETRKHAAMQAARWGKKWREITETFSADEVRRCPACRDLVSTNDTKRHPEVKQANPKDLPTWRALAEALGEEEICRCPKCELFITKDGGCNEMTCFCGKIFFWGETCKNIYDLPDTSCICGLHFSWKRALEQMEEDAKEVEESFWPLKEKLHRKCDVLSNFYFRPPSTATTQVSRRAPLVRIDEEEVFSEEDEAIEDPPITRNPFTLGQLLPKGVLETSIAEESQSEDQYSFCEDHDSSMLSNKAVILDDCDKTIGAEGASVHPVTTCEDLDSVVTSDFDNISYPSSVPLVEAPSIATSGCWETEDFDVLVELVDSDHHASDNSWSSHFDGESTVSNNEEEVPTTTSDTTTSSHQTTAAWEEVSEVSSVVSFHSKTGMSFLEAARAAAASKQEVNNSKGGWKEVSKVPIPMSQPVLLVQTTTTAKHSKPMKDEQDDEMFDADFIFDGVKSGRGGGKQKFRPRVFI